MYVGVAYGYRAWKINEQGDLTSPIITAALAQSQVRGNPAAYSLGIINPIFKRWPTDRKMEAECVDTGVRRTEEWCVPHTSGPQDGCTCGIYCFKNIVDVLTEYENGPSMIVGVVALWGRIQIHEHGAKAQFARPICVADSWGGLVRWTNQCRPFGWTERKAKMSKSYGIPEVSMAELEDVALGTGAPLSEFG